METQPIVVDLINGLIINGAQDLTAREKYAEMVAEAQRTSTVGAGAPPPSSGASS